MTKLVVSIFSMQTIEQTEGPVYMQTNIPCSLQKKHNTMTHFLF